MNFGRQAGTQVNSSTKSGTNAFHGNAIYEWNGRALNADNWFNKHVDPTTGATPTPTGFVNANQWADSIGGPIRKDKTFFFVDNEGLRVIIPVAAQVFVPTPAFENYVLGNIPAQPGALLPEPVQPVQQRSGIGERGGREAASAAAIRALVAVISPEPRASVPQRTPCANTYHTNLGNFAKEWLLAVRVDHQLANNDKMYVRYHMDKGTQPTYTDPLNPIFNTFSPQPSYDGQLNETHTFGSKAVNQFILSGAYYRAIFSSATQAQAQALYPTTTQFFGRFVREPGRHRLRVPARPQRHPVSGRG